MVRILPVLFLVVGLVSVDAQARFVVSQTVDIPGGYRMFVTSGDWLFVGQPDTDNGGNVLVYQKTETGFSLAQTLSIPVSAEHPSDAKLGYSLAVDGTTLVAGAVGDILPNNGFGAGYVFEFDGSEWQFAQRITSDYSSPSIDAVNPFDLLGNRVAISGDIILLGDWNVRVNSAFGYGVTLVFRRSGGVWTSVGGSAGDNEWLYPGTVANPDARFFTNGGLALKDGYALAPSIALGEGDEADGGLYAFEDAPLNAPPVFNEYPFNDFNALPNPVSGRVSSLCMLDADRALCTFTSHFVPLDRTAAGWNYGTPLALPMTARQLASDGARALVQSDEGTLLLEKSGDQWVIAQTLLDAAGSPATGSVALSGDLLLVAPEREETGGSILLFSLAPDLPTISPRGKTRIRTSRSKIVLKGTSTNATSVKFKAGKGRFRAAKGSSDNWKVPLRLRDRRTVVTVRASAGAESTQLKFVITRK